MVLNEEHQPKKKNKAKKIPLRGLGVAQLEKLRIEEQHKNHNNTEFSSSSPSNIPSPPAFTLPDPNSLFRPSFSSSSSSSSSQIVDFFQSESLHLLKNPPTQMVNRAALVPSLSGDNLQIELPSLQSYTHLSWSDQERIAGINTQWPFNPEIMSFPYKSPHLSSPLFKLTESASMDGKVPLRFEYKPPRFREAASYSGPYPVDWKNSEVFKKKRQRENCDPSDNKFQALGSSTTLPVSRIKLPMNIPPTQRHENHEFSILSSQFTDSSQQHPFYSFLPVRPMNHEIDVKEQRSEAKDDVDTRLKL